MPRCGNPRCHREFVVPPAPPTSEPRIYCDLCKCTALGCQYLRFRGDKCKGHAGVCAAPGCTAAVMPGPGKRLCKFHSLEQRSSDMRRISHYDREVKSQDSDLRGFNQVMIHSRATRFKDRLEKMKGTREHIATISAAIMAIAQTKRFNQLLDDTAGWKNLKSWLNWAFNSIEPSMLKRMRLESIIKHLTPVMLTLGQENHYLAERIVEELILMCHLEIEKTDVKFAVEMAFMAFGPFLAPFSQAAGMAVGGGVAGFATRGAISLGQNLTQTGVTALSNLGATEAIRSSGMSETKVMAPLGLSETEFDWNTVQTRGRSTGNVLSAPETKETKSFTTVEDKYHYSVNPMQFTLALFEYLIDAPRLSAGERLVVAEFGGMTRLKKLYTLLKDPPE